MPRRKTVFITLISFFLAAGFAACRHGYHHSGFDKFDLEAAVNRIAYRLDLSESQKVELRGISAEIAAKAKELHTDHEARHQELADLVRQETISRDEVDRIVEDKLNRIVEMTDFVADRLIIFHAALTPEQREKIAEHIETHTGSGCGLFRR